MDLVDAGFGLWRPGPLAAALVPADILKDGVFNLKAAVLDLADRRPENADGSDRRRLPE